jgi:hypothetical protein
VIRIDVFDQARRRWTNVPNGPFPITREQLDEARRRYRAEWDVCPDLSGVKVAPQTTARAILKDVAPALSDFDAGMIGFAVSNDRVRVYDYKETQ